MNFAQIFINAILLGGLYAVVGVGMSMIFGIVRLTNLAHGDFLILASYLSLTVTSILGVHPLTALIIVVPIMFIIGFIIQNTMINRVMNKGAEPPLLITFGLSIVVQNLLQLAYKPDARSLKTGYSLISLHLSESVRVPLLYLINFGIGLAVILLLTGYLKNTHQGQAIRAASDNVSTAALMGVNIKRIYGIAMGISMITAAVAGTLIGMTYNFYPSTGTQYLIVSFGVVVIGGMGSITGTFIAGLILALAQLIGAHFLGTGVQMLAGYFVLIAMLIFRPQGLFSKV